MDKITVYRDIDDCGESFTVYRRGVHHNFCEGNFLADDPTLKKYIEAIGGEENITEGLDNRTQKTDSSV